MQAQPPGRPGKSSASRRYLHLRNLQAALLELDLEAADQGCLEAKPRRCFRRDISREVIGVKVDLVEDIRSDNELGTLPLLQGDTANAADNAPVAEGDSDASYRSRGRSSRRRGRRARRGGGVGGASRVGSS